MVPIKILFFDIDGTLLDHATGAISPNTRKTLQLLHRQGFLLCIATGRGPASLPDLEGLHFDAFCTYNGSLCYTEEKTLLSNPLAPRDVSQVIRNAAAIGRPVSLCGRSGFAANGIDRDLSDYFRLAELELSVNPDFDRATAESVYQILVGFRESDRTPLLENTAGVRLAISWERAADVVPVSSSKGAAIQKILEHFHLDASQAMAFGDSLNDLEMLKTVGIGVAMGNAIDQLKATADDVCGPVDENGIYHYCVARGLI
jgi:Cof subfamily protein (haloacid dehalogenase superfamily)